MKYRLTLFISLFISLNFLSAQDTTCQKFLAQSLTFDDFKYHMIYQEKFSQSFLNCGLDSFELEYNVLAQAVIQLMMNDMDSITQPFTLNEVMVKINELRALEGYQKAKQYDDIYRTVKYRFVTQENWADIKQKLTIIEGLKFSEARLSLFEKYLFQRFEEEGKELHQDLATIYEDYLEHLEENYSTRNLNTPGYFNNKEKLPSMQLDSALQFIADTTKPIFVLFNGHACVNGIKFIHQTISEPMIVSLLAEQYYFVHLNVDERQPLTVKEKAFYKNKYPEAVNNWRRPVKNIGDINQILQVKYMNRQTQPMWLIMDYQGTVLYNHGDYGMKENQILEILNNVLKKK